MESKWLFRPRVVILYQVKPGSGMFVASDWLFTLSLGLFYAVEDFLHSFVG